MFILTPTLDCPARCSYCFMAHDAKVMAPEVLDQSLDYVRASALADKESGIKILFHGGEPLAAGFAYWRHATRALEQRFTRRERHIGIQSNLWLLDREHAELFAQADFRIGTSLDGPKSICDVQRGAGYFEKTMAGIQLARSQGILSGAIATLSAQQVHRWPEVFDFFLDLDLSFIIRPVLPAAEGRSDQRAVTPERWGALLVEMLDAYIKLAPRIQIAGLDNLCKSIFSGHGDVCTFTDCLGQHASISPHGDLFPCHRLCGVERYRLGHVASAPPGQPLYLSPVGRALRERIEQAAAWCQERACEHFAACRSGCYTNMLRAGDHARCDPYCVSYRQAFSHLRRRLTEEITCPDNLRAIEASPPEVGEHPLYRRGPLIDVAKDKPHPLRITRAYQGVVGAVALAETDDLEQAAERLCTLGVARHHAMARRQLVRVRAHLFRPRRVALNDLFLHITTRCPNACLHCYAEAGPAREGEMAIETVLAVVSEATRLGSNVTITGGEPLAHSQFWSLVEALTPLRQGAARPDIFLSTSLSSPRSRDELERLEAAFTTIGVSLDGDESTHDRRRGPGSYRRTLENLEQLTRLGARVKLGHTMQEWATSEGQRARRHVEQVARELGVCEVVALPLLPIGRGARQALSPLSKNLGPELWRRRQALAEFSPRRRCLLGKLHVDPDGDCYPCYACHWPEARLGNVDAGLAAIVGSPTYAHLCQLTVDDNPKCRRCAVRYLCGGACLAWQGNRPGSTVTAPPPDCGGIRQAAEQLHGWAVEYLRELVSS